MNVGNAIVGDLVQIAPARGYGLGLYEVMEIHTGTREFALKDTVTGEKVTIFAHHCHPTHGTLRHRQERRLAASAKIGKGAETKRARG